MTNAITMTKSEDSGIVPSSSNRAGFFERPTKVRQLDADYLKARERLRAILSGLSAIVEHYDAEADRDWSHVGSLNHYAEVIEGSMCFGENMTDGTSAFHPDNL